jgi:HEAT repeat protein
MVALQNAPDRRAERCIVDGLDDFDKSVRGQAIAGVLSRRLPVLPELFILFERGDPAAEALAALGDVEVAHKVAKKIGELPDAAVAAVLGTMLRRKDLGAVDVRRDWVHALGQLQSDTALTELEAYLQAVPADRKKPAGRLARSILEARKDTRP